MKPANPADPPAFCAGDWQIIEGDCLQVMREMPTASVDAIVTDPPYGLSREPNITEVLEHWLAGDDYKHRGSGFMGKSWDSFVPGPSVWRECYRVLKPGGYMLVFASSRTFDLMGISLRLAGFEVHPFLAWLTGQGFPKATNLSKMLDAGAGAEREVVGISRRHGGGIPGNGSSYEISPSVPPITAPATDAAKQWDGWFYGKQALKPAMEPVLMVQKPPECRMVDNVMRHGTGAVNVDATRIQTGDDLSRALTPAKGWKNSSKLNGSVNDNWKKCRWPPNVLLSPEGAAEVDRQSGALTSGNLTRVNRKGWKKEPSEGAKTFSRDGDTGGASRFFPVLDFDPDIDVPWKYCAKADKGERNEGCEGLPKGAPPESGRSKAAEGRCLPLGRPRENHHPTVKPVSLMRWLCRLITPPGGLILDMFCGSGSTGVAAMEEGFRFIGIEQDASYADIARARLKRATLQERLEL